MAAAPIGALAMIHGQPSPVAIIDGDRPAVPIPFPVAGGIGIGHLLDQLREVTAGIRGDGLLEQRQRRVGLGAFQRLIQLGHAQVTPPTLGQRVFEIEPAVRLEHRQVLIQYLLLQCHRGSGDDQPLAARLGDG